MKKTILIVFTLILSTSYGIAQDFKLGLKAGMNFSQLKTDEGWLKSESNAGYLVGVWGRLGGEKFHIQPEAYFSGKNTKITVAPEDAPSQLVSGDLKFTNIDVPILIGTKFPIGPLKAKLQAGPLFSFVIDEEATFKDNINASYNDALKNYKDKFSALVVGTGFDIMNFSVDLRYEHGLGNISKYEGTDKQTLNIWTISLGYSFF